MAFKRPPPPGLEPQWHDLRERTEELRRDLGQLLDDCDRFLQQCRLTSLTHKEAVAQFLVQHPGRVFGSRQIQKALEGEGMVFSNPYTVSAMLTRLQRDGRVVQVKHGKWATRSGGGPDESVCAAANVDSDAEKGPGAQSFLDHLNTE